MKSIIGSILTIMVIGGLSSCKSDQTQNKELNVFKVTVKEAKPIRKIGQYQFAGKVIADDKMILSTKVIGQIQQVYVDKGERVKKGQLLVKIRNNDIQSKLMATKASLREAMSSLTNTLRNYDRISRLYDKGSATRKELDDISTAKEVGEARVESITQSIVELNELMTYTNLRSPIDGFVSKKFSNVGGMATPGSPIIALESLDRLRIEIGVPEFELELFESGDTVQIEIDALKRSFLSGFVSRKITSSAFSGGQYQVFIELNEDDENLVPGMFARVVLLKNKELKTIVPNNVIIKRGQLTGLYTVNQQSEAMLRWVRLGREYNEGVEVLSGLAKGEQFVVSSESKLSDGVKVEIVKNI